MADPNDASDEYMQHAQVQSTDAAIESFMRRMQSKARPDAEAEQMPFVQGDPSAPRAATKITVRPPSVWERLGQVASTAGSGAVAAVGDIATGVMKEGAPAVVGGINDAARNAVSGVKGVADWLQENIGGEIPVPSTGNELIDRIIQRPLDALKEAMPEKVKGQETVTGQVLREGARFLVGFVPAMRSLSAAGVSAMPAALGAGAISDATTMDPDQEGLSNFIQAVPALQNPVNQYLSTDPNDPEAVNRLRHAIEGLGFGAMAEGIVRGIRAVASARKAVPEIEAQKLLHGETGRDVLMVGSPDQPLIQVGRKEGDGPADPFMKLVKATAETETGVPTQVTAKGVVGSAEDAQRGAFRGRPLPDAGVAPANMAADGTIYVGPKNGVHFEISEAHAKEVRTSLGLKPGQATWKEEGFVTPDGQFLDRKQAFEWVEANEKRVRPSENMQPDELDALDYREQVPGSRRVKKQPPSAKEGNRGQNVQPPQGAQPESTTPSVRGNIGAETHPMSSGKITPDSVEEALTAAGIPFRKEASRFSSEALGPSASTYYKIETPQGPRQIRISDHEAPTGGGPLDFRIGDDATKLNAAIEKEFGGIAPEFHQGIRTRRVAEAERNLADAQRRLAEQEAAGRVYASTRRDVDHWAAELAKERKLPFDGKNSAGSVPAKTAEPELYVNFARINEPDDVKTVIRDMANAFKGSIDEARRGVQTNEQTAKLADELGMTAEDLLSRRKGEPLNAEQSLAARRLLNASAEKLLEQAKVAADPNASMADLYNFRRMMAIHHAVQSEVVAARTETARALQAWSIPAGGNVETARNIQSLMDTMGGSVVTSELARRMVMLSAQGVPNAAIHAMARRGALATTVDAVKESFVLGLLWSPSTHLVNAASNLSVAFQQVYERGAARAVGDFLGTSADARVVDGEAIAMAYGMVSSLKDAFRLAGRALVTGEQGISTGSKIDVRPGVISSETVSRERGHSIIEAQEFAESPMGRAIDFIGATTRIPGRLLGAEDEFFKTIAYRAELHAQSLRQATQEGYTGPERFKRMMEIANEPPEHIRISAADAAMYTTFQNKVGSFGEALMKARDGGSLNPTFLVLPFIKTPTNILRYTFERTPLAPLVSQWRDDIAAGGARRDLALARMATGSAIIVVGMDYASSGLITGSGPSDPGKREALQRQGWQANSILIDGKYYSFNRLDPIGMVLGFAGSVAELTKTKDLSPEDYDEMQEIIAAGIGVLSATVVDKSYFQGIAQVMTAIQSSERGSQGFANFINRQTGALVPFSSAHNVARRFTDPVTREVNSPMDAIMSRIAELSERLPPARDLWGQERKPDEVYGRTFDVVSPAYVSQRKDSPIDAEIERLNVGIRRIGKKSAFQNAAVNFYNFPQVYDEYVRLAGNDLKHPGYGMGAKDFLDAVVTGKHGMSAVYETSKDGPEGGKAAFIRKTISEYRKLAQDAIMEQEDRFPEFVKHVRDQQHSKMDQSLPAGVTLPPGLFGGSLTLPR